MKGFKEENGQILIQTNRLCELLNVSDRALTDWKRQGLQQHSRSWWNLQEVLKWRGLAIKDNSEI